MALWTPYADEALDLTKRIKKEISPGYDQYQYHQDYFHMYQYPVYNGHVSPASGVSVSSYESYYQSSYKPVPLSPPASPNDESGFSSPSSQHFHNHTVSEINQRRESFVDVTSPYNQNIQFENTAIPSQRPLANTPLIQNQRISFSDDMTTEQGHIVAISETPYRKRSFDSIDVDSLSDDPDFQAFERVALRAMAEKNGGTLLGNNPRMRRAVRSNNESCDDSYRKQRERNNFAAKQSRDRRKLREIHLALKVSYLRREVAGLKTLLAGKVCSRCQQSCRC